MNEKTSQFSGKPKTLWVSDLPKFKERQVYERFKVYMVYLVAPEKNGNWRIVFEVGDKTGRTQLNVWCIPHAELNRVLRHFARQKVFAIEARAREFDGTMSLHMTFSRAGGRLPWRCAETDYFAEDF